MTVTVDQLPVNLAYGPVTRSFAELLRVSEVVDEARVEALGMDVKTVAVLVHSGSRGLGESILRGHTDRRGAEPLPATSDEGRVYLGRHDGAVRWARVNRALIAERMLAALGCAAHRVLDVCHNSVEAYPAEGEDVWLHRKGAVPADRGAVVIPGSRGDHSYLVEPLGDGRINLHSLAHGAGRKWQRSAAKGNSAPRPTPPSCAGPSSAAALAVHGVHNTDRSSSMASKGSARTRESPAHTPSCSHFPSCRRYASSIFAMGSISKACPTRYSA
jgi:hypothetical protein